MKISEITETTSNPNARARVKTVQGNRVTVDHGDGTETTVDTKKNPNALDTDSEGNVSLDTDSGNSAQRKNPQQRIRPGQRVQVSKQS